MVGLPTPRLSLSPPTSDRHLHDDTPATGHATNAETTPLLSSRRHVDNDNLADDLEQQRPRPVARPRQVTDLLMSGDGAHEQQHSGLPDYSSITSTSGSRPPSIRRLRSASPAPSFTHTTLHSRRPRPTPPERKIRSKLLFALITILLAICVYASFVDDFMGVVEAAISCGTCIGLLAPLQALAHVGDDVFVNFFVGWCTKLGIEDADVCNGAIGTQAPILAHDLRSISLASHAAKNFCSTVFGLCPLQQVIPYNVKFEEPRGIAVWHDQRQDKDLVSLKKGGNHGHQSKRRDKKWLSRGRKPFQVVHLSDVHVDREYLPGATTICSKVICCRDYGFGSTGPGVEKPAGRFGNKHCDTPVDLVKSMLAAVDRFAPHKNFTIFTGDVVESAVWAVNEPNVSSDLHLWNKEMQSPSYPAFGNQQVQIDIAPVNAFPRTTTVTKTAASAQQQTQWVFDIAAQDWKKWIGHKAAQSVKNNFGCYSVVHPGTELRIISVNTNYWYKQNFWLYDHDEPVWDPNGILTWMKHELHEAEAAGQRAWIIGHMPFGKVDAMRDQSNYAAQIFNRYHNTIAAHFYGHSHVDEFEIAYSDYNNRQADTANGIAYIAGALTPASGNPVFRVYDIDPDTYEVMDFTPYYANKTEPAYQFDPQWKPYYRARESYGGYLKEPEWNTTQSLNGQFWHRVTEVFEKNETAFQLFNTRLSRGGKVEDCSGSICKNNTICMLRAMRSESNCAVIQPGLSFKDRKRDTEAVTEPQRGEGEEAFAQSKQHDFFECEGPGLGSMLRKIAQMSSGKRNSDDTLDEQPFAMLLAFQDAVEQRLQEEEKLKLGDGWIGSAKLWTNSLKRKRQRRKWATKRAA
ncbi:hypothetical protein OIO90_006461 [Microbotryomycetes sp. JL221]|nr:hypothetical protein OIO90_006461 [Microbotryomycetes sp. JL221]